jgi:hypothetical protein
MEPQDREREYERNIWESYRKEWATASPEQRTELNKRMLRWQELVKNGLTPSQAYDRVMAENSNIPPRRSPWPQLHQALTGILALALAAAVIYSVIITGEIGTLKAEVASLEVTLASTQAELTSTHVELTSTHVELTSTQTELSTTKQALTTVQTELSALANTLTSVQDELETTQAQLEAAEAKLRLYEETIGVEVFSGVQPPYEKESIGRRLQVGLVDNQIATEPTWAELITFLLADPTDNELYQENVFDCGNFAEMLHNNAEVARLKAAFVAVFFTDKEPGHALNAFRTADKGLVYVDCTGPTLWQWRYQPQLEYDKIAYVVKGKEFGAVSIDQATSPAYSFYEQIGKSSGSGWLPLGMVERIEIYW